MRKRRIINIISILLVFTLVIGYMPNMPVLKNSYVVQALDTAPGSGAGDGDKGNVSVKDTNTSINGKDLSGLGLTSTTGETDLHTRGSFTGETDNYFYIYYMEKKRAPSSPYYKTLGYSCTSAQVSASDNVISNSNYLCSMTCGDDTRNEFINMVNSNGRNGWAGGILDAGHTTENDVTIDGLTTSSKDGYMCEAQLYSYPKEMLYNAIAKAGKLNSLGWATGTSKSGELVQKATVYLQSVNKLCKKDGSLIGKYPSQSGIISKMQSLGFSATSQSDVKKSYNLPVYLIRPDNHVSFIDVDTGKVLAYEKLTSEASPDVYTINYSKTGPLKFSGDKNSYSIVGGAIMPKSKDYIETHSNSAYYNSEIRDNARKSKDFIFGAYSNTAKKHMEKMFNEFIPTISVTVNGSKGSSSFNDGYKTAPEGYVPAVATDNNTISFSTSKSYAVASSETFPGYQLYIFVSSGKNSSGLNVVCYDESTGQCLMKGKVDYSEQLRKLQGENGAYTVVSQRGYQQQITESPDEPVWCTLGNTEVEVEYTFPPTLKSKTGNSLLNFHNENTLKDTTVEKDIPETLARVQAGGKVMDPKADSEQRKIKTGIKLACQQKEDKKGNILGKRILVTLPEKDTIYRGAYTNKNNIPVLYYAEESGELIARESTHASTKTVVKDNIVLGKKLYHLKKSSYKPNITAEEDIATTKKPVMTSKDKAVTDTPVVLVPQVVVNKGKYVIRVECTLKPSKKDTGLGDTFIIPSQWLGKQFSWSTVLKEKVIPLVKPPDYTHTYTVSVGNGKSEKRTCSVTITDTYGTNHFDWVDDLYSILSPLNYLFTDIGGLTHINSLVASGGHEISKDLHLDFFSHRVDVDKVSPVFAQYMNAMNKPVLDFMRKHSMADLAEVGLEPNRKYNDKGGEAIGTVSISSGSKTEHGQQMKRRITHSSCGAEPIETEQLVSPSEYTTGSASLKVIAEPSIVAKPLPVGTDLHKNDVNHNDMTQTFIDTITEPIAFYPTYKMFLDGKDAWLLGKEQRKLKSVNVAQVSTVSTEPVVKMATTWSRDKQDIGKNVMKGGYQYSVSSSKPAEFKVVTYIVVPKEGWVKDSYNIRAGLLSKHQVLVNSITKQDNFVLMTNLPEAFSQNTPASFKKKNPYAKGVDNVQKSRIKQPTFNIDISGTQKSVMSLESLDGLFGTMGVDNVKRLKAQLEKRSWYEEKFSGFEVVKQVTNIKVTAPTTKAVNFLRNGAPTTYNDLAHEVYNIPNGVFGYELGMYGPNASFMGTPIVVLNLTKPYTFYVRGMAYDDRS